jgi:hypothetical protein
MRYRKLRIAWSVACGLLAALLCVLWMRSLWYADSVIWVAATGSGTRITNFNGSVEYNGETTYMRGKRVEWTLGKPPEEAPMRWVPTKLGFAWGSGRLIIPYWSVLLLAATFSAAVWVPWSNRFSLRSLLIVTTLVAVGMGLIVYA